MSKANPGVCLVVGAGDGLGAAIGRAFAKEGLTVCLTRRPRNIDRLEHFAASIIADGGKAHAFGVDARHEAEMIALVDQIERDIGPIEVMVFNIGANVRFGVAETTQQVYRKVWEMAGLSGFIAGREAARVMKPRQQGTIIFTGATASLRGRDGFSAFAGAKHALRALAQSMARELGPQGIHVAHVIIDGALEGAFIESIVPDYQAKLANSSIMHTAEAAKNWVWLWRQHKSAWTHELDLRPWTESW